MRHFIIKSEEVEHLKSNNNRQDCLKLSNLFEIQICWDQHDTHYGIKCHVNNINV